MYKNFLKKIIDLVLSLIVFPFFVIIYIIVGTAIKLEDGGPVLYRSERLGKDGKIYIMYKFRSMKIDAPDIRNEDGTTYNAKHDPRITKVGRFIRETSIDEIPQILNVLKGDMSIIGPRPSLPDMLSLYKLEEMPKLDVKPGITGYTQAYYRNSLSGSEKRLKDAWYAKNITLLLDVKIFLKTILTVVKRDDLYTNDIPISKSRTKTDNL